MADDLKVFAISYKHGGKTYSENISAASFEDAEARVESMFLNGEPFELVAQIDNPTTERINALMEKLGLD